MVQMGCGLCIVDTHRFVLCESVLHFQRESWTGGQLETGGYLRAGGLVCFRPTVNPCNGAFASFALRDRELVEDFSGTHHGKRYFLVFLHGAPSLGWTMAKWRQLRRGIQAVIGQNLAFQPAHLLGHSCGQPGLRILPEVPGPRTPKRGTGKTAGASQASSPPNAIEPSFSV